jgi:hypothetical protein
MKAGENNAKTAKVNVDNNKVDKLKEQYLSTSPEIAEIWGRML